MTCDINDADVLNNSLPTYNLLTGELLSPRKKRWSVCINPKELNFNYLKELKYNDKESIIECEWRGHPHKRAKSEVKKDLVYDGKPNSEHKQNEHKHVVNKQNKRDPMLDGDKWVFDNSNIKIN